MEVMERKTSPRKIYNKLLGNAQHINQSYVEAADRMVDEALGLLEDEEPGLRDWLQSDTEANRLLNTHSIALHVLIWNDSQRGYDLDRTMGRVDALNYRLFSTMAVMAAMRERPLAKELGS